MRNVAAPLDSPGFNTRNIEADRKSVAERFFANIDLLVLPTTTARTPAASDADADPLALSPKNTLFANYYGVPAISVPCGSIRRDCRQAYRLSENRGVRMPC